MGRARSKLEILAAQFNALVRGKGADTCALERRLATRTLIASDARSALLLVTLACEGRFELGLLPRRHEERMFLRVLDNLFGHHTTLETSERALD